MEGYLNENAIKEKECKFRGKVTFRKAVNIKLKLSKIILFSDI